MIPNYFKELLDLFSVRSLQDNNHKVEYVIVGGFVTAFQCARCFTGDGNLFVRLIRENTAAVG